MALRPELSNGLPFINFRPLSTGKRWVGTMPRAMELPFQGDSEIAHFSLLSCLQWGIFHCNPSHSDVFGAKKAQKIPAPANAAAVNGILLRTKPPFVGYET